VGNSWYSSADLRNCARTSSEPVVFSDMHHLLPYAAWLG
jgi:formylglycine-generating enzyme required for sulfatase activity